MSDKPFNLLDGPDTGLKEDYNGTIASAMFTQNTQGTNQNYSLQLVVDADDGEQAIIRLGVGKSWSSYDGGETVVGATSTARFHQSTAYWRFITAANTSGAGEEMAKRNEAYGLLGPCHANFWVGMRFHFDVAIDHNAQTQNETGQWVKVEGDAPTRPWTSISGWPIVPSPPSPRSTTPRIPRSWPGSRRAAPTTATSWPRSARRAD